MSAIPYKDPVKNEKNTDYNNAVDDFINGNGKGIPKSHICEILMQYDKNISEYINQAFKKKLKAISVMPYGECVVFAENPVCYGRCTQSMWISTKDHKMMIYFDRN
jgi:hypothetical protein